MSEDLKGKKCLHEGHRARMEEKVLAGHVSTMTDVELLEMLLYNVIRRQNTNEISHRLLDRFGSLGALLTADPAAVMDVDGVGDKTAVFSAVVGEMYKRASREGVTSVKYFDTIEQIGQYFIGVFKGDRDECVMMLMLDAKNRFLDCKTIHKGVVSSASVSMRTIVKTALDLRADRIVVAHNHPSGDASPSDDDIILTRMIRRTLSDLDVDVIEHILVADDKYMPLIKYMNSAAERNYEF